MHRDHVGHTAFGIHFLPQQDRTAPLRQSRRCWPKGQATRQLVDANGHIGNSDALHDFLRPHHGQRATQSADAVNGNRAALDDDFLTGDAIGKTNLLDGCGAGRDSLTYFAAHRVDAHGTRGIDRHRITKSHQGHIPARLQGKTGRAIVPGVNQQGKRSVRKHQAGSRTIAHGTGHVAGPDQETRRSGLGRGRGNHLQRLDIRTGKAPDKSHVQCQAVCIRNADRDIGTRIIIHLVQLRLEHSRDHLGVHPAHIHFGGP